MYIKEIPPTPQYPAPPAPNLKPIPVDELAILYLVLVHNHPEFTVRLIDSLDEPQHTFVVHVDSKAPQARSSLSKATADRMNVFVMPAEDSLSVTWGGYSVVNATIHGMKYAWLLERHFDYIQLTSGTSYPIKSNRAIRSELSQRPGAIYMDVADQPSVPGETTWFHYVECDDRLHRIHRMSLVRGKNNDRNAKHIRNNLKSNAVPFHRHQHVRGQPVVLPTPPCGPVAAGGSPALSLRVVRSVRCGRR